MMKVVGLLVISLFFHLQGLAQLPLHNIFPMGVIGYAEPDTFLNKREVLMRERIKKITAVQTIPPFSETLMSKTIYLNNNGCMDSMIICLPIGSASDSLCRNKHVVLYDSAGRMILFQMYDPLGVAAGSIYEYMSTSEIKITTQNRGSSDSMIEYRYFNKKGKMIREKMIINGFEILNAAIYYNPDGLVDSVSNSNHLEGYRIFKRRKKKTITIIEMETALTRFEWLYNLSNQCISTVISTKNSFYTATGTGNKYTSVNKINYYYNPDGTLSKVTEKTSGRQEHGMVYSYER